MGIRWIERGHFSVMTQAPSHRSGGRSISALHFRNQIKQLWINLRSSLWFLPSLMVAGSAVLAVALIEADIAKWEESEEF